MNADLRNSGWRRLAALLLTAPQTASYAPIGGQAVIEGVMIRSPRQVATAVLRSSKEIAVRREPFLSVLKRSFWFRLPVIRGGIGLIESMAVGMKSLAWSAEMSSAEASLGRLGGDAEGQGETQEVEGSASADGPGGSTPMGRLAITGTLVLSLGLGILIFFYIPLVLTELTGVRHSILFNVIDGIIRLVFLLVYLRLISLWGEMRRIFEFHGAEHKAIHNFESGKPLSPETAATFTRLHPRCGTAFLLTVMITSIVVFAFFGRPDTLAERLIRLSAIPLIGGLAFEAIRFSGKNWHRSWVRVLAAPGLELQRLTTREPDLEQLGVAIRAVEAVTPLDAADQGEIRVM